MRPLSSLIWKWTCGTGYSTTRVGEEPAVFVFHRGSEMAAGAGHGEIGDAFEIRVDHLVDVAGDYVLDSVFFRQLMDGVVRVF